MKVSITSGRAEGPTKLNAFDNALLNAKIGDINLIKVSSILPSGTEVIPVPKFPPEEIWLIVYWLTNHLILQGI